MVWSESEGFDFKKIEWKKDKSGSLKMEEKRKTSELKIKADLVLLAMGFVHPVRDKLISDIGLSSIKEGMLKLVIVIIKLISQKSLFLVI